MALMVLWAARGFTQTSQAALQSYFEQGEKALAEERYSEAEGWFEKLRKLAPNVAEVYGRLGLVYFQEKRFEEAVPVLRRALKLKPSLPKTDILLGMSLSEIGHYSEALPILENAFRHDTDPALKRMSGLQLERTYTGLRRDKEAIQTALELDRLYPKDPEILYQSSRLYGNYAYLSLQKLAQIAPDSVWLHEAAADAYQSAGNHEFAAAEYRRVLAQAPNRPGIHYRLGRALLAGSTTDAAREFEEELALDPTNSNAAYELAEIHRKAGDTEKARDLFLVALKYYPDFEEANVGLGRSLIAAGKFEDSLAYLDKAVKLNPRDEVTYYQLSLAYKGLGKLTEQRAALERFQEVKAANGLAPNIVTTPTDVTKQEAQ